MSKNFDYKIKMSKNFGYKIKISLSKGQKFSLFFGSKCKIRQNIGL